MDVARADSSRRRRWSLGLAAAALLAVLAVPSAAFAGLQGGPPAADCQPFASQPCLLPFPNNLFTKPDSDERDRGRGWTCRRRRCRPTRHGVQVGVAPYDRNDGFSPGSTIVARVPGLDNPAALRPDEPRAADRHVAGVQAERADRRDRRSDGQAPADLGRARLQRRRPRSTRRSSSTPARTCTEGHTLRRRHARPEGRERADRSRRRAGSRSSATRRSCRAAESSQKRALHGDLQGAEGRRHQARRTSTRRGTSRSAAAQSLTSPMLCHPQRRLRAARRQQPRRRQGPGHAPPFTVTSVQDFTRTDRHRARRDRAASGPLLPDHHGLRDRRRRSTTARRARPLRAPEAARGNVGDGAVRLHHPDASAAGRPGASLAVRPRAARLAAPRSRAGNVEDMASEHNFVFCATDWWGLSLRRTSRSTSPRCQDINKFPAVVDRLQQGVLNTLFLGRLMREPATASPRIPRSSRTAESAVRHLPSATTTATARAGSWAGSRPRSRPTSRARCSASPAWTTADSCSSGAPTSRLRPVPVRQCRQRRLHRHVDPPADPRPDAAALGSRRAGRVRAAHDVRPAARSTPAHTGADADRLRRPPGQPVLGRRRGADDRRQEHQPALDIPPRGQDKNLFYGIPAMPKLPVRAARRG